MELVLQIFLLTLSVVFFFVAYKLADAYYTDIKMLHGGGDFITVGLLFGTFIAGGIGVALCITAFI